MSKRKEVDWIFKITIKGKHLRISDAISYPASGLDPEKVYTVIVKDEQKDE